MGTTSNLSSQTRSDEDGMWCLDPFATAKAYLSQNDHHHLIYTLYEIAKKATVRWGVGANMSWFRPNRT